MSDLLRVFVVGATPEDTAALRDQLSARGALTVVGAAVLGEVQQGTTVVPDGVDAVMMTPGALGAASLVSGPAKVQATVQTTVEPMLEHLTPRERTVLALVADGLPNREIARELDISEHTVKFHLASVFGKLGATSRTDAVRRGLRLGLIEI